MVDHVNSFAQDTDIYPKNMTEAYNQVVKYKDPSTTSSKRHKIDPCHILSSGSESDDE